MVYQIEESVPFCFECGSEVNSEWKFCPNCKMSLQDVSTYNQTSFTQKDGVIVGDVTINQQNTSVESQILVCEICGSEGNITLRPCIRKDCSIKSCDNCITRYDGNCGPRCHTLSINEFYRAKMKEDERLRKIREQEQQIEQKIRHEQELELYLSNKAYEKKENLKLILGVIFLAIPAIVMLGFSFYSFTIHSENLEYTCKSGQQIDGWQVLDGYVDCSDGSDEIENEGNLEHKQWVEEYNDTLQPDERNAAISCCGFIIFGFIFYYAILDDFWELF